MSNNMVINTNEQATRIHNMYNKNVGKMNAAMTRIATAQKINSAKDNASVYAISEKMRERIRANDQANQNVQNDTALLKVAQDGLGNTLDILTTLKERAVNAANDSNINQDRTKIVEEVRQLVAQIDDNANKVKFNGRTLLNGAGDPGSGVTSGNSTTGTSSANAVTATGAWGNMAVYGITGLTTASGAVTTSTKLTELIDSNGNSLFQAGDKITINYTDNGTAKQNITYVDSSTTVEGINFSGSQTTSKFFAAGTVITGATDDQATAASVKATADGVYFIGTAEHNISNFSISVTTGAGMSRTNTESVLSPIGIQQSYGNDERGSSAVYTLAATGAATNNDEGAQIYKVAGGTNDKASTTYSIEVDGKKVSFAGTTTIKGVNDMLRNAGINVRIQAAAAGDALNYDGAVVNQGTYGSGSVYKATAGLSFIVAPGESVGYIKTTGGTDLNNKSTMSTSDGSGGTTPAAIVNKLTADETAGGVYSNSSMLPQGQALQFFVGGEANFGVNFAIGKATAGNLLGGSADSFAARFSSREGAEGAINIIENAINKTLTEQTRLGAMESRLGYTSDNLVSMNTNLEAGVSAYRDSDMAKEMTEYMKFAVMSQASQYMLANAGNNAYNVLQLLQP